ncbi:MAG: hypothetical protein QOC81_1945 [Thermoanaerobaculia bacterium]|jgi:hypothetical protein|nr:hypothetical protein [Thermoanaerobaculia bacterium]
MQRLRLVPDSVDDAIVSFDDYVAIVTLNAARDVVRHRHPERTRLEKRLRYILTRDSRLAVWQAPAGLLCGLAQWSESQTYAQTLPERILRGDLSAAALLRLFEASGAPLRLDALIDAALELSLPHTSDASPLELLADDRPSQQVELETRELVSILWSEVLELPERQRTALLLNLRIAGTHALALFPLTGVASLTELSEAMGMTVAGLAGIWSKLPLDDLSIATMMRSTRQQIINLRKSARERLRRRMNRRT